MDKMKQLLVTTAGVVVAVAVIGIAISGIKNDISHKAQEPSPEISSSESSVLSAPNAKINADITQNILLMEVYSDPSGGNILNGSLIDKYGRRHTFDFTPAETLLSTEECYNTALENYSDLPEEEFITDTDIREIYQNIQLVDPDCGYVTEFHTDETGTYTLYCVKDYGTLQFIKIYSEGSISDTPTNESAKNIYEYFINLAKPESSDSESSQSESVQE